MQGYLLLKALTTVVFSGFQMLDLYNLRENSNAKDSAVNEIKL